MKINQASGVQTVDSHALAIDGVIFLVNISTDVDYRGTMTSKWSHYLDVIKPITGQFPHGQFTQKYEKIKLEKPNLTILS